MKNLCGIPLEADTEDGLAEFALHFEFVWWILPDSDRESIQAGLQRVIWSRSMERVDPRSRHAAGVAYPLGGICSEIRFYAPALVGGSKRHQRNLIAHELRHAWQFATDFFASESRMKTALYLTWEYDAIDFAKKLVGPESNFFKLQDRDFPTDEDFDRIADDWRFLTDDQRFQVRILAAQFKTAQIHGEVAT